MACDFTTYNALRDDTRNKSGEAQASCAAAASAQDSLTDAQAALEAAQMAKAEAYDAWQKAERAENAEAMKLGIDPMPVPPPA